MMLLRALIAAAAGAASVAAAPATVQDIGTLAATIEQNLQQIADSKVEEYKCAFAIGLRGPNGLVVSVASGKDKADGTGVTGESITVDSKFVWGSVTKMTTGVGIIRLANEGYFNIHDPVAPILDPYFAKMGYGKTMEQLFGPEVRKVTVYQLATMTSGVPDYDTAKPNETNPAFSTDSFREYVYKHPAKDWAPLDMLTVPWVAKGKLDWPPGSNCDYSSTNFVLLGLILAAHADVPWNKFDQGSFRTQASIDAGLLKNTVWAVTGDPNEYTSVHGYDRTCYNGQNSSALPGVDDNMVHGVFGGWTASDIVSPVQDIADLAYAIYGPRSELSLVTPDNITMMTSIPHFYGFATFLLSEFSGQPTDAPVDYGTLYGHLGATYGWNSVVQFQPTLNISISVATNVESMEQAQPSDAFCIAYNRVRQIILGEPIQDCLYDASGYFGTCVCPGNKYRCRNTPYGGMCELSYYGNETYNDCSTKCGRE